LPRAGNPTANVTNSDDFDEQDSSSPHKKHKSAPKWCEACDIYIANVLQHNSNAKHMFNVRAPVVQPPVSTPKSNLIFAPAKDVGTKVVQLDDTLLVLPPTFTAKGWPEAKLY
jgi:hypothetical protein